jgi:hypothetical protein
MELLLSLTRPHSQKLTLHSGQDTNLEYPKQPQRLEKKNSENLDCLNHYYTVTSGDTVSTLKKRALVCLLELIYREKL